MGTETVSDDTLETIFDAGFQCSSNEFNQEKFNNPEWMLNKGIWDFHLEFRKWLNSPMGKEVKRKLALKMSQAHCEGFDEGYDKGREENTLLKKLQSLIGHETHCDYCSGRIDEWTNE